MAKVMTVVEWEKRRNLSGSGGLALILPLVLIIAGSIGFFTIGHPEHHVQDFSFIIWMAAPAFIWLILFQAYAGWQEKKLEQEHPEMAHLNEWRAVMGTTENYPAIDTIVAYMPAASKLRTSAQCANTAFMLRDQIGELMAANETEPIAGIDWTYAEAAYQKLAKEAETRNAAYLKEWDLFVKKTHVLTADLGYTDPRKYREDLL